MYIEVKDLKKVMAPVIVKCRCCVALQRKWSKGKCAVIQGTSGSGKSTLLNCIGGLDTIDSGSVVVNGTQIAGMTQMLWHEYRRANLGIYLSVLIIWCQT